jgi:hypothetical protein
MPQVRVLIVVGAVLLAVIAGVLVVALGSDDDPGGPTSPEPTLTLTAEDFGPAPTLGQWVVDIFPTHASVVPQRLTRTVDPGDPRGVCFEASFTDLPESALWFRMAVDAEDVTVRGIWIVDRETNPTRGKFCFDPPAGLEPGIHTAAVAVQAPDGASEPRQIVQWAFEVVP